MRITYIAASLPYGSGEIFLAPEIKEFLRQGHELAVVALQPRGREVHDDVKSLLPIMVIQPLFSLPILYGALCEAMSSPLRTTAGIAMLLRSRKFNIAIKNLAMFPKALWLARLVRRAGTNHIHAEWGGCTSTLGMIAGKVSGVPWSFTVHSWELVENNLLRVKAESATVVRVVSRFGERRLRGHVGDRAPVHVIHVGIDLPPEPVVPRPPRDQFRILVVAALVPIKGIEFLIKAWAVLRDRGIKVSVEIFGKGPLRETLTGLIIQAAAEDYIALRGLMLHDRLLSQMSPANYDAAVLPSIVASNGQQEGIPMALVEAMARGIPVIATQTGGIVELLEGGAGMLVPPADPEALADAIEALYRDPELRAQLRATGRQRIEDQFRVEASVKELTARMTETGPRFAGGLAYRDSRS
jgi:glycosyltransferase involved in cell wall biosynthesis